jgi:hypothetical protein
MYINAATISVAVAAVGDLTIVVGVDVAAEAK